jgi:hypothetical protein
LAARSAGLPHQEIANMKEKIDTLDAIPSKRLFLSIIADYNLERSICELVDNGLDVWVRAGRKRPVTICVKLNVEQQTITVKDDAGGLRKDDLAFVVAPGQTGTQPSDETIGIFGVGTKRAVVALAQDIKITTRFPKEKTHRIEFDDAWIGNDDDWNLNVYQVDDIDVGTTIVELQRLRTQLTTDVIAHLKEHLRTTYARFLDHRGVTLEINGDKLQPLFFDNWAFPPRYSPRKYTGTIHTEDGGDVSVEAYAGLTLESSPAAGEYGVYIYCNDRLIARALKSFHVGFIRGFAGLPHPKVSLTRVLIFLKGNAQVMPWNSSKSDISTQHVVFRAMHTWLMQVVKDYAALSRIWMGNWPSKVFKYETGTVTQVHIDDFPNAKTSYIPPPPRSRPRYGERVAQKNKAIAATKPWTQGLFEGVIAVELISKNHHLELRNRLSLILLDSTLEIAMKEYLVNESGTYYNDAQLLTIFAKRHLVVAEVKRYVTFDNPTWTKIAYYNNLRNKLVHERASVSIPDREIADYREVVEKVLSRLYGLKFKGA